MLKRLLFHPLAALIVACLCLLLWASLYLNTRQIRRSQQVIDQLTPSRRCRPSREHTQTHSNPRRTRSSHPQPTLDAKTRRVHHPTPRNYTDSQPTAASQPYSLELAVLARCAPSRSEQLSPLVLIRSFGISLWYFAGL
jgi:hypothetical protein